MRYLGHEPSSSCVVYPQLVTFGLVNGETGELLVVQYVRQKILPSLSCVTYPQTMTFGLGIWDTRPPGCEIYQT